MSRLQDARNRLAAHDVASLASMGIDASADDDKGAAVWRIVQVLQVHMPLAIMKYRLMLTQLQTSELTINFSAYKFFNRKPEIEKYVSQFEGGQTWGNPTYMDMRNEAEEALFDYAGMRTFESPDAQGAQQWVKTLGDRDEALFEGAIRPKYAALNYASLKYGSAAQWGKSYMVLKDYVKHNATYVHTDSFDLAGSARQRAMLAGSLANFTNMQRLLVYMAPDMLKALDRASNGASFGEATQPPNIGPTNYIEAHVHSEIRFERDIAKLVINRDEVLECLAQTKKLHSEDPDKKRWKVIGPAKLTRNFEKFARKYGIELAYS